MKSEEDGRSKMEDGPCALIETVGLILEISGLY